MKFMKNGVRRALSAVGYELRRSAGTSVHFDNFANLAGAYEHRLVVDGSTIEPNELRPKLLARLMGTPPSEAYFLVDGLARTRHLVGDVCEFGVAQGETSALIANEIASGKKRLHLFDSFEGLPRPTEMDQLKDDILALGTMEAYTGTMSCPEDMVLGRLSAIRFPPERCVVHRGFIEQIITVDKTLPSAVSFAYVDFDFYEPIKIALEFLHGVTSSGAVVVVDDYDFFSTGAKAAVDEFVVAMAAAGVTYDCLVPDTRLGHFAVLTRQ